MDPDQTDPMEEGLRVFASMIKSSLKHIMQKT